MIWLTVIILVFILLLLILVHEWGHFYTAKKAGCKVEEFGFGFPPRLFAFKKGETTYSFNLLPLGGFVKIEGENMEGDPDSPTSFASKSATWRIIILSAGVFMNVVLAAVFLSFQAGLGMPVAVTDDNIDQLQDIKTYIVNLSEGSPAEDAGFARFDRIVSVNGLENPTIPQITSAMQDENKEEAVFDVSRQGKRETISLPTQTSRTQTVITDITPDSPAATAGLEPDDKIIRMEDVDYPSIRQVSDITDDNLGQEITMIAERNGEEITVALTPREAPPANEGPMGVLLGNIRLAGLHLDSAGLKTVAWWEAPWEGLKRTWLMLTAILTQFWLLIQRMFTEGGVGEALTGPVGIAIYANEAANMGISYLLEFSALISINLAIINLLPLPALDGGRIMFVIMEKIIGRRLPAQVENLTHLIGFALLMLLMVLITFRDVQRYF